MTARRRANKQDIVILKNEFEKIIAIHIKSSDHELVALTEGVLDNIEALEVYVESENAECMSFSFSELTKGNELGDSVFITVRF